MFPPDAITIFEEISGNVTTTIVNNNDDLTVLAITFQQSKDLSDTILFCGNDPLAKNYGKDFAQTFTNYKCNDDLILNKTGNDNATVIVTYIPYFQSNTATTTELGYNPSTNISSSSDIQVYGSFSAGEILIAFLLLCMIVLYMMRLLALALSTIKTKKRYLQYGGGDVEIRDDL